MDSVEVPPRQARGDKVRKVRVPYAPGKEETRPNPLVLGRVGGGKRTTLDRKKDV